MVYIFDISKFVWSDKIDSLKYQMSIKSGLRDRGIRKSESKILVPFRDQVFIKRIKIFFKITS